MNYKETVQVIALDNLRDLGLPSYATDGSSGVDLLAAIEADITIEPGGRCLVPTGLKFLLPSDMEIQIRSRSGLAAKFGVTLLNSPGTVDSDYEGEVLVCLINHGTEPYIVKRGNRIAQAVFAKVTRVMLAAVGHENIRNTKRGPGGFGSTGGF